MLAFTLGSRFSILVVRATSAAFDLHRCRAKHRDHAVIEIETTLCAVRDNFTANLGLVGTDHEQLTRLSPWALFFRRRHLVLLFYCDLSLHVGLGKKLVIGVIGNESDFGPDLK